MTATVTPPAQSAVSPLELFDINRLLSDDERDIAATVRKFVETRLKPNVEGWFESATLPKELAKEFGDLGVLGMHLEGYGCAGTNAVSYGLVHGAGGRRQRLPQLRVGAGLTVDVLHLPVRLRGAEERVAAAA